MTFRRLLLLAALPLAALGASAPHELTALALLHAAADAPNRVSFVAQVELLTIGSHGSQASIFRVEHRSPNLTRRWYVSPPNLYGDWTISRGNSTYSVDVKRRRVVVTRNESFGVHPGWRRNLALLTRNYTPILGPDATVSGRVVRTIALVNRYTGATTMRLWIDRQTNLMLERQVYSSDGSVVEQMHFDDVRFTGDIPLSVFGVPSSYAIASGPSRGAPSDDPASIMARCGFAARAPRYLPEGFTPIAADLAKENGIETLHLLYSDGLRTVSLFENARGAAVDMAGYHETPFRVGTVRGQSVDEGPTTLLAWSRGALHFALVGDLSRTDLEKIAASVSGP
jgi:negative regulator of sigma E activity